MTPDSKTLYTKLFKQYRASKDITIYQLLNDGYTVKMFPRKVDSDVNHKILRLELSKKHNVVVTEFCIADELGMVLYNTKESLDILNGDINASNEEKCDRHFSVYNK